MRGSNSLSRFVLRVHNCSALFQSWSWGREKKGRPLPKAIAKFKAQAFPKRTRPLIKPWLMKSGEVGKQRSRKSRKSREAKKQEKQKSREAREAGEAEKQKSRKAEKQEKQKSKKAEKQRSRKSRNSREAGIPKKILNLIKTKILK